MIKIAQGAEAVLHQDKESIIKERLRKNYRHPHLDQSLRKFRTRREAKILGRLQELQFPAPHLQEFSDKRMSIVMDFIPGEQLKDVLKQTEMVTDHIQNLAQEMGERIGQLHAGDIIHGDLTTSNMIQHMITEKITFIDFGLSQFSDKVEDKAVDLSLLDRALATSHSQLYPLFFDQVLEGYTKTNPDAGKVLERLEQVKRRGRNKKQII
ncbi:MAG: KEOPS complex kinase/ATPase Bud32 [Nanoarchaeota archaeon]|nr:KEOPS complex kinase/ATPase Bud32 [Nanoarchaeota archaeon]